MQPKKKILVAVQNSGLGHATRCIPVIEALENHGFEPVVASDGAAMTLLKKEFPQFKAIELPPYHNDPAKGSFLKTLIKIPGTLKTVQKENRLLKQVLGENGIDGIISDSRPGIFSSKIPSVYFTHRINVADGNFGWITSSILNESIKKYTECWIPDVKTGINLTGKLGHSDAVLPNIKYIGPLSRLNKKNLPKKYDLMVVLSGTEPQRSALEEKMKEQLPRFKGKVILIRGVVETEETVIQQDNITVCNFMGSTAIEQVFNESEMVICRSSYSTIMDMAKLGKKVFFIPEPGDSEQEYLAKKLKRSGLAPYSKQQDFRIDNLQKTTMYKGLKNIGGEVRWKDLFSLFEGE